VERRRRRREATRDAIRSAGGGGGKGFAAICSVPHGGHGRKGRGGGRGDFFTFPFAYFLCFLDLPFSLFLRDFYFSQPSKKNIFSPSSNIYHFYFFMSTLINFFYNFNFLIIKFDVKNQNDKHLMMMKYIATNSVKIIS
jgi:hypothetical protein